MEKPFLIFFNGRIISCQSSSILQETFCLLWKNVRLHKLLKAIIDLTPKPLPSFPSIICNLLMHYIVTQIIFALSIVSHVFSLISRRITSK